MGSAPDSLVYNPEDVLLALLPATRCSVLSFSGMLLDVALPFYYSQSDGVMRYFARYLLMGKTLIGIRIRVNENELNPWPRRKCVQY